MMKKQMLSCLIIVVFGMLLTGCGKDEEKVEESFDGLIKVVEASDCDEEVQLYVESDIKVYTYCLEKIEIYKSNKYWELREWMTSINQYASASIEEILAEDDLWNDVELYRDGGSKLYMSDDFRILQCNTLDGNKDVYIGNDSMRYEEGFCK